MSRNLLHGDASFTWTVWWEVARDLNLSDALHGWREQFDERDVARGVERGWGTEEQIRHTERLISSGIVAQDYAMALSSLGWCLRDAGALAASFSLGYASGADDGYDGPCWEPNAHGDASEWYTGTTGT